MTTDNRQDGRRSDIGYVDRLSPGRIVGTIRDHDGQRVRSFLCIEMICDGAAVVGPRVTAITKVPGAHKCREVLITGVSNCDSVDGVGVLTHVIGCHDGQSGRHIQDRDLQRIIGGAAIGICRREAHSIGSLLIVFVLTRVTVGRVADNHGVPFSIKEAHLVNPTGVAGGAIEENRVTLIVRRHAGDAQ